MLDEKNQLVIPTGYMGSGSSALTDILSEFDSFHNPNGSFEYVFLHCPDGVFDLEDKLLLGNNALRSDEALHSFSKKMKMLYDVPFWWPGNYKKFLSENFLEITNAYIESLVDFESDNFWYHQEKHGLAAFPKLAFNKVIRTLTRNNITPLKPLYYKGMILSFPTPDVFYEKSRQYIEQVLQELVQPEKGLIVDQLILPHNAWRIDNYFDGYAECFIVDRDPRDTFILNKYLWEKRYGTRGTAYPTDVHVFCTYYKKIRGSEIPSTSTHVHRIHFEDLIYRYDETIDILCRILKLNKTAQRQYSKFNPRKSIHNTQLFLNPTYKDETLIIERELEEYLYSHPYEFTPNQKEAF